MFSVDRKVSYSDITGDGYADIAQIADYFQDCSCFHADSVGGGGWQLQKDHGCACLLAAWQIVVDRYPVYGEELKVCTQPYGYDRVMAKRNFMIFDGEGKRIAVANSWWFLLDTASGAPLRMKEEVIGAYDFAPPQDMDYAPRKVDAMGIDVPEAPFTVERFCIDTNRHMNNVWYLRHAMNYLPEDFRPRQVRAEYRKAAVQGDIIYPFLDLQETKARVLMKDESGEIFAVVEFV